MPLVTREIYEAMSDGEPDSCEWYGALTNSGCDDIIPDYFGEGMEYWKDFIGYVVVCVSSDKRTVRFIIGCDTD